jgi:hypothetical protein
MLHLDAETLAALADDEPSARDAEHLRDCAICAREVEAYRALRAVGARASEAVLDPPLTSWATLAPALRDAGLIRDGSGGVGGARFTRLTPWLRVAAVITLIVGGVLAGRLSAPGGQLTASAAADDNSSAGDASLVGNPAPVTSEGKPIVSLVQALKVMQRAENDYRVAAAFIAAHDSAYGRGDVDRYRTRLAALDKLSGAAQEAVNASPGDPVLNQYLLSARSARRVTLQQLGSTLPAGYRLASQ